MFQTIKAALNVVIQVNTVSAIIAGIDYNFCGLATLLVVIYENLYGIGLHKWFFPLLSFSCLFVFVSLDMILPFSEVIQNLANFLYVFRMFNMMEDFEGDSDVKIQQYQHQLCGECANSKHHKSRFVHEIRVLGFERPEKTALKAKLLSRLTKQKCDCLCKNEDCGKPSRNCKICQVPRYAEKALKVVKNHLRLLYIPTFMIVLQCLPIMSKGLIKFFACDYSHKNPKSIYDLWNFIQMGENPTRVLRYGVFISLEHASTVLLEYMVPLTNVFAWVIFWAVFVQETFNFYVMLHQKIKSFVSRNF
jgi:hypothetical protein